MSENLDELYELYVEASDKYYNTDEPILSDEFFDEITEKLMANEFYAEKIRGKIQSYKDGLVSSENLISVMLSLNKIKYENVTSINKISLFLNSIVGIFYYSPKFDGMAIKVINDNGKKTVLTRGGQDVTEYLHDHKDIKKITRPITHGELVITEENFERHYSEIYANKRNCVLGVMKRNEKHLDFIELTDGVNHLLDSPHVKPLIDFNQDLEQLYYEIRNNTTYQLDGLVISKITEKQVIHENYPTNSVAVKFKSPTAQARVNNVIYTQKKTGALIPVFHIEPTLLEGSTITKVTAYNYQSMKSLKIGIGAIIEFRKSGDIVPIVTRVIEKSDNIKMPDVEFYVKGVHLMAVDQQQSTEYKFELAFNLLGIDGFGTVLAKEVGMVVNFDIIELFNKKYRPMFSAVLTENNFNKFKVIYDIKSIPLDLLVNMLQFDGCGTKISRRVAEIMTTKKGDVVNISNLSENVKTNIIRGEGFKKIVDSMNRIKEHGVGVTKPLIITDETITFEMTGNPPNKMTKDFFKQKLAQMYQGTVHTTLTKETKVLFVDSYSTNSGKMNKARKNNTKIISYEDVLSGNVKLN